MEGEEREGVDPVKKEVRENWEKQKNGGRGTCSQDVLYERIIYERKRNPASSRDFLRLVVVYFLRINEPLYRMGYSNSEENSI